MFGSSLGRGTFFWNLSVGNHQKVDVWLLKWLGHPSFSSCKPPKTKSGCLAFQWAEACAFLERSCRHRQKWMFGTSAFLRFLQLQARKKWMFFGSPMLFRVFAAGNNQKTKNCCSQQKWMRLPRPGHPLHGIFAAGNPPKSCAPSRMA